MPDLFIICITNYDPFGFDQMVYTIKNTCEEEPELVYNDGVKILYFNSVGKKGGTKNLRSFLKYIEDSKEENIVDDATEEIGNYVNQIKKDNRIEGEYMTVGEWIDGIVKEAVEEKDAEIATKDAKLAEKDAEIEELKKRLALAEA